MATTPQTNVPASTIAKTTAEVPENTKAVETTTEFKAVETKRGMEHYQNAAPEQPRVLDKNGIWVINTSQFAMRDADNGVVYESMQPTKVRKTPWMDYQPTMMTCDDPFSDGKNKKDEG